MNVEELIKTAERLGPTPEPPEVLAYEQAEGPWEVKTVSPGIIPASADWTVQRLGECESELATVEAHYQAAIERLNKRRDELEERARRGVAYFRFKLEQWATRERTWLLKGKAKSVQLMHGTFGWRKSGGRLKVEDKDALAAWLSGQPIESGLYRMKIEPEMRALQEHCRKLGEVPPGCMFEPERDDFYVKAEAPEEALMKGTP